MATATNWCETLRRAQMHGAEVSVSGEPSVPWVYLHVKRPSKIGDLHMRIKMTADEAQTLFEKIGAALGHSPCKESDHG